MNNQPSKRQLELIGRVPKVGDLMRTIYSNKIAVITSVRWLPVVSDFGTDFVFLDDGKTGINPALVHLFLIICMKPVSRK